MAEGKRRRRPTEDMGKESSERKSEEGRERRTCIGQESNETTRRLIRQQYRQLIASCQQNRDLMLSNRGDKLTEALEDADKLFAGVSEPREAALDAQFLVLATNLGKEKANQLQSDMAEFDSIAFAEDLLTYMGINRLEREDSDSDEDQNTSGFLPNNAWYKLGEEAKKYFRRAPVFHFMLGTFTADPPVEKPRIERQRKKAGPQEETAMPAQLKKMEESHQEATEKEVERILGLLQAYHQEDPNTPISYLEFVTDPRSFARTVENMFYVSFLIRDGLAGVKLDPDKLPIIEPLNPEGEENDQDSLLRKQAVISMNYEEWQKIVETFEISAPMIPPTTGTQSDAEQS
ncbi:non-structural maintenance of chromosomes element 4 homolog A [Anolis carolinensis]|uniref:Non-structural maintenance of chromosomes element 4 n=1 Tax=Anolis carolinensis TaxID=28377 RepID=G1KTQ1_ANOCA|nr:PREDICTED: non-structural maintenance of chromosomes element 4 homolog A [Anolis carolinensis]|eukprot:XP_003218669.1 PREDICTED: non-structural maintenance of chromosomes element 4 homolog A [Anolis carolinensis]